MSRRSGHVLPGSWEPTMGANALRLSSTDLDPAGPSLQVRGSPLDSLRPWQTPDSWLGVKGSRVQIRPSRLMVELFEYISTPSEPAKGHPLVKWPFQRRAPIMCPGLLPGHVPRRHSQASRPVKGSEITEPPRICTAANCKPGGHHPPPTVCLTAGQTDGGRGYSSCGTRTGQGAQARPAHAAVDTCPRSWSAA